MEGFIFGGNTGIESPQELAKKRELVRALQTRAVSANPRTFGEGLSAIGQALAGRMSDKAIGKREETERQRVSGAFNDVTSGLMGGGYAPSQPAFRPQSAAVPPVTTAPLPSEAEQIGNDAMRAIGRTPNNPTMPAQQMTPQQMIIAGAQARGLDPVDVATAISYETAGTFDPTKAGPTTQWGQHRGFIQFGEPQAQEYGVNWDDPVNSQLNPENGAVWNYLDKNGVTSGMGLDQIYSAINAGGVNRMNRTDENNGGAPGTVADKVAGMGAHRAKAAQFLGGEFQAQPSAAPQQGGQRRIDPQMVAQLSELASNPYLPEGQRAIVQQLLGNQMAQMDPMRQMELERGRLEIEQLRNPTAQNAPNSVREYEFYAQQEMAQGRRPKPYGEWSIMDEQAGVPVAGPELLGTSGLVAIPDDAAEGGVRVIAADGSPLQKEQATEEAARQSEKAATIDKAASGIGLITSIMDDPALASITGMIQGRLAPMSQAGTDLNVKIQQLQGQAFLQAFESLKGGGQITQIEGEKATAAMARLNRVQGTPAYTESLAEVRYVMERAKMRAEGGNPGPYDFKWPPNAPATGGNPAINDDDAAFLKSLGIE